MNEIRRLFLAGVVLALGIGFAGSAGALNAIQLGPGSVGVWEYVEGDTPDEDTWVTGTSPFELLALANATAELGGNGGYAWDPEDASSQMAYLVASAIPKVAFDGFDITIENDGGVLDMIDAGWGTPPVADPNSLAPHGIFDTWFEIYAFNFDDVLMDIYDTKPLTDGEGKGYIEAFNITINDLADGITGVHFDLFTLTGDGLYGDDGGIVKSFAPYSHDATFVPEPTGMLLFAVGLLVVGGAIRRR